MPSAPATTRPRLQVITGGAAAAPPATSTRTTPIRIVAHAGLGAHRRGGAPDRSTLRRALRLGVDAIELDVRVTADGVPVVHHDSRLQSGAPVADVTIGELRALHPSALTLDEAVAETGSTRLVLDVKTPHAVAPLGAWLAKHERAAGAVVCSPHPGSLAALSARAPRATLWQTFPDLGHEPHERLLRVVAGLCSHRGRHALGVATDLCAVLGRLRTRPRSALARLAALPWRRLLPQMVVPARDEIGAAGIAVHHPLVSSELCTVAHALGLGVTAWTVNEPDDARRVAVCGVDHITTDHVVAVRRAIRHAARASTANAVSRAIAWSGV